MPTPKPFTAQSVFKTVADAYLLTPPIDNCLKVQLPKPALNLKNIYKKMSHREESNPQHSHYRSDALPSCATVAFDVLQTVEIEFYNNPTPWAVFIPLHYVYYEL